MVELANFKDALGNGYDLSHKVKITVCPVEFNEGCEKIVQLKEGGVKVDFNIADAELADANRIVEEEKEEVVKLECPECPECPDCKVKCPEVPEKECPEEGTDAFVGYIIAAISLIILFMGGGIQIYKTRAGNAKILHRHKGILGYHDANRIHRNPLYRHPKFSEHPIACIKRVSEINKL